MFATPTPEQNTIFSGLPLSAVDYTPQQRSAVVDYLITLSCEELRRYQSIIQEQVSMAAIKMLDAADSLALTRAEAVLADMQARDAYVYDAFWFQTTGVRRD